MNTTQIITHIVDWLTKYCEEACMNGFVVGVSGGIDSAVTSALCAKTNKRVVALNLPIHQLAHHHALATKQVAWLKQNFKNTESFELELTGVLKALEQVLPQDIQDPLTMANTRSRLRMVTLYSFAAHHRLLVAGTGNKIEDFGVGFFTKYGDGGVDLSPIGDLLKTEVTAIGKELGIIEEIIQAPPTDGLWHEERTDEAQIGATYPELEWAMQFVEEGGDEKKITPQQNKVLEIYRRFHRANRHKMVPVPVCVVERK